MVVSRAIHFGVDVVRGVHTDSRRGYRPSSKGTGLKRGDWRMCLAMSQLVEAKEDLPEFEGTLL
jgi:hypothetical protein